MRRHSIDPENIKKQIMSIFSTSSRKRQNANNNPLHSNDHRRTRRFSVPDRKYINSPELHTIDEVSDKKHVFCL